MKRAAARGRPPLAQHRLRQAGWAALPRPGDHADLFCGARRQTRLGASWWAAGPQRGHCPPALKARLHMAHVTCIHSRHAHKGFPHTSTPARFLSLTAHRSRPPPAAAMRCLPLLLLGLALAVYPAQAARSLKVRRQPAILAVLLPLCLPSSPLQPLPCPACITAHARQPLPAPPSTPTQGVGPGASLPSQQCLSSWNAAVAATGPCGTAATLQSCCPALKALGLSCVEELMGAMAVDPAYASSLDTFNKTLEACAAAAGSSNGGSGSGGSGSEAATAQCLSDFSNTLQNSCLGSFSTCCPAVEKLGTECLQAVMDVFADDATTQAAL